MRPTEDAKKNFRTGNLGPHWVRALVCVGFSLLSLSGWSAPDGVVDRYVIGNITQVMIGNLSASFSVDPRDDTAPYAGAHRVRFVGLPTGVTVTGSSGDATNGWVVSGVTSFQMSVGASALPGSFTLRVENVSDSLVNGTQLILVYRTVSQYTISFGGPLTAMTGVAFPVTVTARDSLGAVVQPFADDVDVAATVGAVSVNGAGALISGGSFVNGVAVVNMTLFGTTVGSLQNTITVTARTLYPGQASRATGSQSLTVEPNVFHHILLQFPGETLTPGSGSGKGASATAATAGLAVGPVNAYLVDTWGNPIRTDRNPEAIYPVSVSFLSVTHAGSDVVPAPQTINANGNLVSLPGSFTFPLAGQHTIEASENRRSTSDSSSLTVNGGSASTFNISLPGPFPKSTISPFSVTVTAVDGNGNRDFTYNRAVLVSPYNASGVGFPSNSWDTTPLTLGVSTTVTLASGQWSGQIRVFKASLSAHLRFDDGLGRVSDTADFQIDAGPWDRLFITLPGQTFTEGAYPGNSPSNVPRTFTAGDLITGSNPLELRCTDASWNVKSCPANRITLAADSSLFPAFIDAPSPNMDPSGGPLNVTNIRLRTAYPADQQRITASMAGVALSQSDRFTVNPGAYNKVVFRSPGEVLEPGTPTEPDGKSGLVSSQTVNSSFPISVYLTDSYFNPILNPPGGIWPTVTFSTTVGGVAIFPSPNPFQMTSGVRDDILTLGTLGSNVVRATDNSGTPKFDTSTIWVNPGVPTRFAVTGVSNKNAGDPMTVTVTAYDAYNNISRQFAGAVSLELWSDGAPVTYPGALSPTTLNFTAHPTTGGVVTAQIAVNYAGKSLELGADNLTLRAFINLPPVVEGFSDPFNIFELPGNPVGLVMTLPGESYQPGGVPIKANVPNPKNAGDALAVQLYAVDLYGNTKNFNGPVNLTLGNPAAFGDLGSGSVNLVAGRGSGVIFVKTAGSQVVVASQPALGLVDKSTVSITAGSYNVSSGKLVLLAPGEVLEPGSSYGKSGTPTALVANTLTTFTIVACDPYYNIDANYSGGSFSLSSNDGAVSLSGLGLISGTRQQTGVYLRGGLGFPSVRVTATDSADPSTKTNFSDVTVTPGAYYVVTTPGNSVAGSTFSLRVELHNADGSLDVTAQSAVYFSAVQSDLSPATISLGVTSALLVNGVVDVQQHYEYVEPIRIKVVDNASRLAYSSVVDILPNGLKYVLTAPVQGDVDHLFPLTVALYDTVHDAIPIHRWDHDVVFTVEAAGQPGAGSLAVQQTTLNNGQATVQFGYTKAEHVVINASGTINGFTAFGQTDLEIIPGTYVKVQLLAPGESARRGIPSLTGKDSSGLLSQAAREPFSMTVYAVDQYWNIVPSISNPSLAVLRLTADDGSLAGRPLGAWNAGVCAFNNVRLTLPPAVNVTAEDTSDATLLTQTVAVPVSGRVFVITPRKNFSEYYTGPPRDFRLDVALYRSDGVSTTTLVSGDTSLFTLDPLGPDLQPLDVTNLVNPTPINGQTNNTFRMDTSGIVSLTLSYRKAEDVVFKATDLLGWQGFNENKIPIHFIPRAVTYDITLPTAAVVGPPNTFPMTVTALDADTAVPAPNVTSTVTLQALRVVDGLPGTGVLQVGQVILNRGTASFQQAYTQSGLMMLRASDGVILNDSPAISMLAGPPAGLTLTLPPQVEAGTTSVLTANLLDSFNNPVNDTAVTFSLNRPEFGSLSAASDVTDALGRAQVFYQAAPSAAGEVRLQAVAGSVGVGVNLLVLGPPRSSAAVGGRGVVTARGFNVKAGDPITLTCAFEGTPLVTRLFYALDGGNYLPYATPISFATPGEHQLTYYGETEYGTGLVHREAVQTAPLVFVSADAGDVLVNYPNPFRAGAESTFIEYQLQQDSGVHLTIYDLWGRRVYETTASQGENGGSAGYNRIAWDGRTSDGQRVGNGGYVVVLKVASEGRTLRRKIVVIQ